MRRVVCSNPYGCFFFLTKIHVGLWEKLCRFVGKITSVCGKNHIGLWEKSHWFVGKIMSVCGKNLFDRKLH